MDDGSALEEIYATCNECLQMGQQMGSSECLYAGRPDGARCRALPFTVGECSGLPLLAC
jgi:hypothetical protein